MSTGFSLRTFFAVEKKTINILTNMILYFVYLQISMVLHGINMVGVHVVVALWVNGFVITECTTSTAVTSKTNTYWDLKPIDKVNENTISPLYAADSTSTSTNTPNQKWLLNSSFHSTAKNKQNSTVPSTLTNNLLGDYSTTSTVYNNKLSTSRIFEKELSTDTDEEATEMGDINRNQTSSPFNDDIDDFQLYTASTILSFGTLGNLVSSVVLQTMERTSFNIYMKYVSLADLVVTLNALIYTVLKRKSHYCIDWDRFCWVWASGVSLLLLVAVTTDRYIAVCHPFQKIVYCTKKRAQIVSCTICITVGILTITSPLLVTIWDELSMEFDINSVCTYQFMVNHIVHGALSPVTMLILNGFTLHALIRRSVRRNMLSSSQVNVRGTIPILFTITFFSLICLIPELIIIVCEQSVYCLNNILNPNFGAFVNLSINAISLNHSFNFVLYCITSSAFRGRLKEHLYKLKNNCFVCWR